MESLDGYAGLWTTEDVLSFLERIERANESRQRYSRHQGGIIDNNPQEDVNDTLTEIRKEIDHDYIPSQGLYPAQ